MNDTTTIRGETSRTEMRRTARTPARQGKASLSGIRALMVDIDDTITTVRPGASAGTYNPHTGSLMHVLEIAGIQMAGLSADECRRRMKKVQTETEWWHWSDFIVALELEPKQFWEFAYETESRYMQPTGSEVGPALGRLREHGMLLYVTSNNPSSGILHKLRLAGLGTNQGCPLFDQLLGATELNAMKSDARYWHKALAHTGLAAQEVAVVGDNLRDDWEVPRSVGIAATFLIDRRADRSAEDRDGLVHVRSFDEIADRLLAR